MHVLVVAHQTATSPELLTRLRELEPLGREVNGSPTTISLVVPEQQVVGQWTWSEPESLALAEQRVEEARAAFADAGLRLRRAHVGDASPLQAIEDELRARPRAYDAIVLSTLPPGRSRWLALDTYTRAESKFDLPVLHAYAGGDAEWEESVRVARLALREPPPQPDAPRTFWHRMRPSFAFGLMAAYLAIATVLVFAIDRTFLVTEILALVAFAAIGSTLLLMDREHGWATRLTPGRLRRGRGHS